MRCLIPAAILIALLASTATALADQNVKIKNVARIEGARSNQLFGYGLVIGLNGTGDTQQSVFTPQSVANMLQKFGITVPAEKLKVKNVAAVIVTADLPPFVRPGAKIDINVSSLGDCRSLQGGTLIQTPLQAANGQVYAVAQGSISTGGFTAGGEDTNVTKNHTTVGRIPSGAIIEQSVPTTLTDGNAIHVLLNNPEFTTAVRVAQAVNDKLGAGSARALDAATIRIQASDRDVIGLIAEVGELSVVETAIARVIVNERTGTVVIGSDVKLSPVAISHGSLSVEVATETQVSQPNPLSKTGSTEVVQNTVVEAREEGHRMVNLQPGTTLGELVRAMNELKVTPRDVVAILQALKQAGALHAELEIL